MWGSKVKKRKWQVKRDFQLRSYTPLRNLSQVFGKPSIHADTGDKYRAKP